MFLMLGSTMNVFSLGMIIPILQGMLGDNVALASVPVINNYYHLVAGWDKAKLLSLMLIFTFIMFTAKNALDYIGSVLISKQRFMITKDCQNALFDQIINCGAKFFDSEKIGHLVNGLYNESVKIGDFVNCILKMSATAIKLAGYFILLALISWQVTVVSAFVFLLVLIPVQVIMKRIRETGVWINNSFANFNFHTLQILDGYKIIKVFCAEKYEKNNFNNITEQLLRSNYTQMKYYGLLSPVIMTMLLAIFIVPFIIIINVVKINITGIVPFLLTYLYIAMNAMAEIKLFNDLRGEAVGNLGAFDSYESLLAKAKRMEIIDGHNIMDRFRSKIEFDLAQFSYDGNKLILDHASFVIPKGKITAIVGLSGSGKTTIINLLLRLYDLNSGAIRVDGLDLKELELHSWRKKIGLVNQDVFIFNTSIRENIIYGNFNCSEQEMIKASQAAEIHEFIKSLPAGYDTILGERGVKLSGGQKQRLSIARAIIHNPEIIILDEATSSLDTKTERLIQKAMDELSKNRTAVIIAHRLSTIVNADNIIVLDKGQVVEQGTHAELLPINGHYSQLYKVQYEQHKT